ncbi:hypothetical protein lerEdw1_009834 [Lerista edwardsae]|nr:hypothetical protein lerEdw1_009834 [Lerista edwardsae]
MRLISSELREGQDSEELSCLVRPENTLALELRWKTKALPRSPYLVVHFHGGGFVAQTSKSHEPYLKSWAQELGAPILSIDYSLAPEAPFPRALEECFYAYCWALKNCRLLGSTAQKVCLAGDSAGGNLCITVSMRAAAFGIKMPDGIMAAYPATLMQASASPSRLLTLLDPLLPLSVLSKCLSAYAGIEPEQPEDATLEKLSPVNMVRRDTALLFRDLRLGASAWLSSLLENTGKRNGAGRAMGSSPFSWCLRGCFRCPLAQLWSMLSLVRLFRTQGLAVTNPAAEAVRRSVSEASLKPKSLRSSKDSRKSQTCENLTCAADPSLDLGQNPSPSAGHQAEFFLTDPEEAPPSGTPNTLVFPDGFQPLRSDQPATCLSMELSPIHKNPFMSPLLAPDHMLKGLPPVYIVACALDPMLDDSVMFARRLRALGQPVTLRVVQDLPHGFLSLSQLCRETRQASLLCTELIRNILLSPEPALPQPASASPHRTHRKLERTGHTGTAPSWAATPGQENSTCAAQEGRSGSAVGGRGAPSPTGKLVPSTQEHLAESSATEDLQNGARDRSTPVPDPTVTPGQNSGPSGGTVGRGVGA